MICTVDQLTGFRSRAGRPRSPGGVGRREAIRPRLAGRVRRLCPPEAGRDLAGHPATRTWRMRGWLVGRLTEDAVVDRHVVLDLRERDRDGLTAGRVHPFERDLDAP